MHNLFVAKILLVCGNYKNIESYKIKQIALAQHSDAFDARLPDMREFYLFLFILKSWIPKILSILIYFVNLLTFLILICFLIV